MTGAFDPAARGAALAAGRVAALAAGPTSSAATTVTPQQATAAATAAAPTATPTSPALAATPLPAGDLMPSPAAAAEKAYRARVNTAMGAITNATRILSSAGIQLTSRSQSAAQADRFVEAAIGSPEPVRQQVEPIDPPEGLAGPRQDRLSTIGFCIEAAPALPPDADSGETDLPRFQELMLEGGKHSHSVLSALLP